MTLVEIANAFLKSGRGIPDIRDLVLHARKAKVASDTMQRIELFGALSLLRDNITDDGVHLGCNVAEFCAELLEKSRALKIYHIELYTVDTVYSVVTIATKRRASDTAVAAFRDQLTDEVVLETGYVELARGYTAEFAFSTV